MANPCAALYTEQIVGCYRENVNAVGDTVSYSLVAGTAGAACSWQPTLNYDTRQGPLVSKENNIFTANSVYCDPGLDIRASDLVLIQDAAGRQDWQRVQGMPMRNDVRLPHMYFITVPCSPASPIV